MQWNRSAPCYLMSGSDALRLRENANLNPPARATLFVLNAAITAPDVSGSKQLNDVNPASTPASRARLARDSAYCQRDS